ncbi:MAG: ion channel [Sphingomonas sp.]|jgi:hypothetical protein
MMTTAALFTQLAVATAMVALTVATHLIGLTMLLWLLRRHRLLLSGSNAVLHDASGILTATFGLFFLHAIEIWAYAALYELIGALPDFDTALYFSTSTYTTIGYGDVILPRTWRVLGAIEGANGVILLGWSTAFFVTIVGRMRFVERELEYHPR